VQVAQTPSWLDLRGKHFVLLGALSAMGPLRVLLSLGASVIAVDINRPAVWEKLVDIAKNSCGKLIIPVNKKLVRKDRRVLLSCLLLSLCAHH
jgi:hypothetical protein